MGVTNSTEGLVAFKVKSTAQKSIRARPATGTLKALEQMEVQMILTPQGSELSCMSHRLLVLATKVEDSEPLSSQQWHGIGKEKIQEQCLDVLLGDGSEDLVARPAPALLQICSIPRLFAVVTICCAAGLFQRRRDPSMQAFLRWWDGLRLRLAESDFSLGFAWRH